MRIHHAFVEVCEMAHQQQPQRPEFAMHPEEDAALEVIEGEGHTKAEIGDYNSITIGQALEKTALSAGDKPIDKSDASAIQSAEARATGTGGVVSGGVAAQAQSAAARNVLAPPEEKSTLGGVLKAAATELPYDKVVTTNDAEAIKKAEIKHKPYMTTTPGGVAESMEKAARVNEGT